MCEAAWRQPKSRTSIEWCHALFYFLFMRKILFILLALVPMLSVAQVPVDIDGVWYYISEESKTAEVTHPSDAPYLSSITIPERIKYNGVTYSVTSIGDYAFTSCHGLISFTIPNSVTSIGEYAFEFCTSLTSITIPKSVTSIGYSAFYQCESLTSVHISDLAAWCAINFSDYYGTPLSYAEHLFLNGEEIKDLIIPNSVTSIGSYAFYKRKSLTSVTIPNSVTSIGDYAFDYCSSLTSVTIPNSVTSIGNFAFAACSGLTSITIPNSVTIIGKRVFHNCI